jgi:tetratricopeptide (TPR) repeat protein/transcriptional regulator with XRE-family HTH domain
VGASAKFLREQRIKLCLSQEALAEAVGVSPRSVNRWEQGRASPQPAYRLRLAQLFGIDSGAITRPLPGQPEGTPDHVPLWHVPLRRNAFFTGRQAVLEHLFAVLDPAGPGPHLQALTGLAGIGKTQTALEYVYRYADHYRGVFWLPADTRAGCLAALGELADFLDLPARRDPDYGRTLAAVREWFRCHVGWLVVLDNLEDPGVLDEVAPMGHGSTLVTTQAQATGTAGERIDLRPLSDDEGTQFLLRRGKIVTTAGAPAEASTTDRTTAQTLVSRLGGLPLALDQAGAYLEETGCGLDVYLDRFRTQQQILLSRRGRMAIDHRDSVDATLNLAYRRIEQMNPAAAELLCLCAFLHPDFIPEDILSESAPDLGPVLGVVVADPIRLDETLADLATLSLVQRDPKSRALTMHRLVQDVVKATLAAEDQRRWAERAVSAIAWGLPGAEPYDFGRFLRVVSQAVTTVELVTRWQMHTVAAARLLDRMGAHYQLAGQYAASLGLLNQAWRLRKQLLGRDHLDTAETMVHLAELAVVLGRYKRADTLARAALRIRQEKLDSSDLLVGNTLGLVGRICTDRGQYREAEPLLRQALDIQTRSLSPKHPQVAETLSMLASVSFMRGDYSATERQLQRALAITEEVLGQDHMVTGMRVEGLGTLYRYWGRNDEAARELQRALAILSHALGSDHPGVMTVLNGLARAKLGQGQTGEAELLARRALEVRERVFGPDHPKLAYSLQCLSEILLAQGRLAEAETLARRGLVIRERVHPDGHQTTSISLDILAQIRQSQGEVIEAEDLYQRALTTLTRTVGSVHPRLVETLTRYAGLLEQLGRRDEAASVRARAESIESRVKLQSVSVI